MEGGDAYGNAALQVMNTSEKDLRAQSPEYVSLRESGMTHEQAQIELAHNSGMGAAAIAVPAGALGGALVAKFERTEGMPCKTEIMGDKADKSLQPDIIDLFNGINNRLDHLLNQIGSNVERVVDMID